MIVKKYYYLLLPVVLLIPILFLPLSSDHIIFVLGGKTISDGGILYSDFIDIKQPLIYYLFSILYSLFGFEQFYYRIFDFLWQSATVLSLIYVINRIYRKDTITYITALIYSLLYVILNYSQTLQIETLVNLPLIWALYYFHRGKLKPILIFVGLLLGIIAGLKITLIVTFLIVILFILFFQKKDYVKLFFISLGFFIGIMISFIPLLWSNVFENFILVVSYILDYSKLAPSGFALLTFLLKSTGKYLGDFLSIFIVFTLMYGIIMYIINPWKSKQKNDFSLLLILLFFANFIMVLFEKKLAPYHFSRLILFISVISAIGISNLIYSIKFKIHKNNVKINLIITLICIFFIAFSPISRYLNLLRPMYYFGNNTQYVEFFTHKGDPVVNLKGIVEVGNYIKERSNDKDKITVAAVGSNQIYLYSGLERFSSFGQSQFYIGKGIPVVWENKFTKELKETNWLVVQTNDVHPSITGFDKSTYELLMDNEEFAKIIESEFICVKEISCFKIYHRNM